MINKIKSYLTGLRKFSVMLVIISVAIWFRLENLMSGDNVTELLKVTGSAFMAANLVEHVTETIKKKLKE